MLVEEHVAIADQDKHEHDNYPYTWGVSSHQPKMVLVVLPKLAAELAMKEEEVEKPTMGVSEQIAPREETVLVH